MLFDLFVIATFILWLNKKAEKRRNIQRWQEEIDDFREWDEKEAVFRIVGNIKRLNRYGITEIYLYDYFLKGANLERADLREAVFTRANLKEASLAEANLWGADLSGADLMAASLVEADLIGTSLAEANLWKADFGEADLRGAKLTIEQLSKVKTLFQTILDSELEKEVKQKYPHLLEMPGFPKEEVEE